MVKFATKIEKHPTSGFPEAPVSALSRYPESCSAISNLACLYEVVRGHATFQTTEAQNEHDFCFIIKVIKVFSESMTCCKNVFKLCYNFVAK